MVRWRVRAAFVLALAAACGGSGPAGAGRSAAVCGDTAIRGEAVPPIDDPGGCGIARPVQVHSIAGVALEPQPILACATARTLKTWIERGAKPAIARAGGRLEALDVAASYVCRNVNRAEEGNLSEHARGRAIDISGFRLRSGGTVSVLEGWSSPRYRGTLRRIRAVGCGLFGTTLGPGSDAFHEDHFHFDIARRRRPYCG